MSLSWRDLVATILVIVAVTVAYGIVHGFDWPLLGSWRTGSLALLVIGLGTCIIMGTGVTPDKNAWTMAATILGSLALLVALIGIIFGSKLAFILLAGSIVALWLTTTTHHLLTKN